MLVIKILEATLVAGQETVTFTDSQIPNSIISTNCSDPDLYPVSSTLSGNVLTLTYEKQSSDKYIAVTLLKQDLDIVDNVTSEDSDKALSAKQGKVLKDAIDSIVIPTVPENITDLDDVSVSDIQSGQVLAWNSTTEKFENVDQSGGGSGNDYSTTETAIGTWIDGSTLYRKVTKLTGTINLSANSWAGTGISAANMNQLVNCILLNDSPAFLVVSATIQSNAISINSPRAFNIVTSERNWWICLDYTKS